MPVQRPQSPSFAFSPVSPALDRQPAATLRTVTTTPAGVTTTTDRRIINSFATRAAFNKQASSGTGAGAAGMPEVKFLIDRQTGKTYLMPKGQDFHYFFARDVLGYSGTVEAFNREAYVAPNRRYIAGTISAFDTFRDGPNRGVYGMSFWATDPVRAPLIKEAYAALKKALPFAANKIAYRPGGQSQEELLKKDNNADARSLETAGISVVTNAELTKGFDFMALNAGKASGKLRFVKASEPPNPPLTRFDIAIYDGEIPTTLPPLAAVATTAPQTYLSHVALKARQDDTPYAFAKDILNDPKVKALEGKNVTFEVTPTGYKIKSATAAEVKKYIEAIRPKNPQTLNPDLGPKQAVVLDSLSFSDLPAFGSKTVNVAELHKLHKTGKLKVNGPREPEVIAPDGMGLPASVFMEFMRTAKYDGTQTLDERLEQMMQNRQFQNDPAVKAQMLEDFRERIEDATVPPALQTKLDGVAQKFKARFPGEDIRIRSSTNSEDLQGFNGAGLFDSYTFEWADANRPNRSFAGRVKKVFASVFNDRAFGEFEFNRVDPHTVAMSALLMPATESEVANGVVRWGGAIPGWDTITVNAQVGEDLVTNPQAGSTPDQFVVGNYGFNGEAEIQYTATTNQPLPSNRKHVMTDDQVKALFKAMKVVQTHFATLYGRANDPNFNIECEFKITADGKLLIKQARPWVD